LLALNLPSPYNGAIFMSTPFQKFQQQRANARYRGIEWELTFKEWVDWWGDDYARRGVRADQLCMQRVADVGPYSLDNIRKGHPRDNIKTREIVRRNKTSEALRMKSWRVAQKQPCDYERTEDEHELYRRNSSWRNHASFLGRPR
jgi:hypothetical protein